MGESRIIRENFDGLNNLVKALSDKKRVRVGFFGKKANRNKGNELMGDLTNPELAAIHEFGSFKRNIPARSILRMPIHQEAETIARQALGGVTEIVQSGRMTAVLKRIGIACENAVQKAFATGGFGRWAPDKPSTVKNKGSASPLIDRGELRRAVSSQVV